MHHGLLYNILIPVIGITASVGAIWAALKINKAAKDGKIVYLGKVRLDKTVKHNRRWLRRFLCSSNRIKRSLKIIDEFFHVF